ncbi:MAG: CHAT domain-containing protein [Saprospiraceae bacterium]
MEAIYLAFANHQNERLDNLTREDREINEILSSRIQKQQLTVLRDSYSSIESMTGYLSKFRNDLRLFHYGGHAGSDVLILDQEKARSEGLSQLLGSCKSLRLVFLNGCSTKSQVQGLLELGIPVVIATRCAIEDTSATQFAIEFYRAMDDRQSIREAFNTAKAKLLTSLEKRIDFYETLPEWGEVSEEDIPWGLYTNEESREALDWKFPQTSQNEIVIKSGSDRPNVTAHTVNDVLVQVLVQELSKYSKKLQMLKMMAEDEETREDVDIREFRGAIVDALPAPVAEQIRKLFAATPETQNTGIDTISMARLQQLIITYDSITLLITYTLLSQLWDLKFQKPELEIPESTITELTTFFSQDDKSVKSYDHARLIEELLLFFDQLKIEYFIDELKTLKVAFAQKGAFFESHQYLTAMKKRVLLNDPPIGPDEIENVCLETESHLANIFQHGGFFAKYKMTTIKNIDLIKRRNRKPKYKHYLVNLDNVTQGFIDANDEFEIFTDSRSVIFLKSKKDIQEYLNLTPFLIDENAYTGDAKTKLYYYNFFKKESNTLSYTFSNNWSEHLEVSETSYPEILEEFQELKEQIIGTTT